jgi:hypothetical protein
MKVCSHKGLAMVVYTRNEHCPPHVHVGESDWDARFQFSFWHNEVALWDVAPSRRAPKAALLEELRQKLKSRDALRRARGLWWQARGSTCLENQRWDTQRLLVQAARTARSGCQRIVEAKYDPESDMTAISLEGQDVVEIEL